VETEEEDRPGSTRRFQQLLLEILDEGAGIGGKQGGNDGLVSPVARYRVIAYRGFDESRCGGVVGAEFLREPASKRSTDRQCVADLLVKLPVARHAPERPLDRPFERPFLVDVMSDEVPTRARVVLDDLVRLELSKRLVVPFDRYEEATRRGSLAGDFKKALFTFPVNIVFLVRRARDLTVPNSLSKFRVTCGSVALRVDA
jgi:hypothetical protein